VPKLIIAIVIGILIGQFLPESICRGVVASPGAPGGAIMTALPFLYMIFVKDLGNPDGPICAAYGSTLYYSGFIWNRM
jgi:DAACS family dicarboxylate/amino acid:cation Na+ or H+ symporter